MRPEERIPALLYDMLQYCGHVTEVTAECTFEQYRGDLPRRWALERVISVVGEAASKLPAEYRLLHPEIP